MPLILGLIYAKWLPLSILIMLVNWNKCINSIKLIFESINFEMKLKAKVLPFFMRGDLETTQFACPDKNF